MSKHDGQHKGGCHWCLIISDHLEGLHDHQTTDESANCHFRAANELLWEPGDDQADGTK